MSVNLSELFPPSGGGSGGGGGDCNIPILDSPPANPEVGERFFSSTDGYLYIWYGAEWVAIGGAGGGDGGGSGGDGNNEPGDPEWSSVSVLINTDNELGGSKNIIDATGKSTVTVVNGCSVSTLQYKYGTGSVEFNSGELRIAGSASDFTFGANDFTIETWVYLNSASSTRYFIDWRDGTGNQGLYPTLYMGNTSLAFYNGADRISVTLQLGVWQHVCVQRKSGVTRMFIDGVQEGVSYNDSTIYLGPQGGHIYVGGFKGSYYLDGFMDDFRICNGIARYDHSGFTPPDKHPTKEAIKRAIVIQEDIPQTQEDSNDADLS